MATFNPEGSHYKKYIDPKTSQKEKDKLYKQYGKKYNWPKGGAAAATPADPVQAAVSTLFGAQGGPAFNAGTTLATHFLPEVSVSTDLTPEQKAAIDAATQSTNTLGQAPVASDSERMMQLAASQGLQAPQILALREAAMQQMNDAFQNKQRQLMTQNAAAGRAGGQFGFNNLMGQYLQSGRDLNRDIMVKDIDYRQKALTDYADAQSKNFSNFWEAKNTANLGLGTTTNNAAQQQRQASEYNANQQYKRGGDIFGSGVSGAGWQNYLTQQATSNKMNADQIKAMWKLSSSGGGGGGESVSNNAGTEVG